MCSKVLEKVWHPYCTEQNVNVTNLHNIKGRIQPSEAKKVEAKGREMKNGLGMVISFILRNGELDVILKVGGR